MSFLKTMWKASSKHKKLSEEMFLKPIKKEEDKVEIEEDVVTFKLKYLGSTIVEKIFGEKIGPEAIKSILKSAKDSRNKLISVNVNISPRGIAISDLKGNDIFKVSIYRISKCSTDTAHKRIFSFISTDCHDTTECHAFLCSKRKIAETVTLSVAHAFSMAFEAWRILPSTKEIEQKAALKEIEGRSLLDTPTKNEGPDYTLIDQLIDLDTGDDNSDQENVNNLQYLHTLNKWVAFEEDFENIPMKKTLNQVDLILS